MDYRPGLNQYEPLMQRMTAAMAGAKRVDIAVAYAKSSGVGHLLRIAPLKESRAVVGLGFGISDPPAVEQLAEAGVAVRAVVDSDIFTTSQFHPKLYLIERPGELRTVSSSANLTGGAWTTNVEQYEEMTFVDPSPDADEQRLRFETLWEYGTDLATLRRSGDWDLYRERARDRRRLEQADRRRLVRLDAKTGRLIGQLARRDTRAAPAYVGITHPDWWERQLRLRDQTDRALFWRKRIARFQAVAAGGMFLHLVKDDGAPEESRAIQGFSTYSGEYEVGDPADLFRRYGQLLGVQDLRELYSRLNVESGRTIGVIHLDQITELEQAVTLSTLRAHDVAFARNIVSGKRLTLEELALVLDLGGLSITPRRAVLDRAAEVEGPYAS